MFSGAIALPNRKYGRWDLKTVDTLLAVCLVFLISTCYVTVLADNFTDLLYTSSFRGSFAWVSKLDWIGVVLQFVISAFSLIGMCLIILRIMTTILYLSARNIWDEVHDLKNQGESQHYDFGMLNMAQSWAKGKAGTGLDAILGAVLLLLPDVYKYCDANEKSNVKLEQDTTIPQYILKIALNTTLSVFIIAMAWNGTLVQGMAVTVDAASTLAEHLVSVNYSGFVDDLVNSGTGYKFTYSATQSKEGELRQALAKELYGKVISNVRDADAATLKKIGENIENIIEGNFRTKCAQGNFGITLDLPTNEEFPVKNGKDELYSSISYTIVVNSSGTASSNEWVVGLKDALSGTNLTQLGEGDTYYHIFFKQTGEANGSYFNVGSSNNVVS